MIELSRPDSWFDDLYRENKKLLMDIAYFLLNDKSAAEDISHEAYIVLWAKEKEIRNHPNPTGYLIECVRKMVMNWNKRAQNSRVDSLTPEHERFLGAEDPERIEDYLPPTMSDIDRQIVVMRAQGFGYEDIGKRLGCSARSCEARIYRLRNRYKKNFDRDAWDFGPLEK